MNGERKQRLIWLALGLVLVIFLAWLVSNRPWIGKRPEVPPMPPEPKKEYMRYAPKGVLPPGPPKIKVVWQHSWFPRDGLSFNVYACDRPSLRDMVLKTNVTELSVTLVANKPMEFFGVKALYQGVESDWGIRTRSL